MNCDCGAEEEEEDGVVMDRNSNGTKLESKTIIFIQ